MSQPLNRISCWPPCWKVTRHEVPTWGSRIIVSEGAPVRRPGGDHRRPGRWRVVEGVWYI